MTGRDHNQHGPEPSALFRQPCVQQADLLDLQAVPQHVHQAPWAARSGDPDLIGKIIGDTLNISRSPVDPGATTSEGYEPKQFFKVSEDI